MRVVVIGLGVQGRKRSRVAGSDLVATVDPDNREARVRTLAEVPAESYDAAIVCTPDAAKRDLIDALLQNGKHVLVEKALPGSVDEIAALEATARRHGVLLQTAYNHRFEPHVARLRELVAGGELGRLYRCRAFYGNGTAALVRASPWRDRGAGVFPDLASHLLDMADFLFGAVPDAFSVVSSAHFENAAPDHVVIAAPGAAPQLEFEMSLLSWRNEFFLDLYGEKGSAHIRGLCKWGPSSFVRRQRVLPAGRPPEEEIVLVQDDPTWELEYAAFRAACVRRVPTDLRRDRAIAAVLTGLEAEIIARAGKTPR